MFNKNNNRYLIKTPTGYENFKGVQKKSVNLLYTFTFDDNSFIKCSSKHAFLTQDGFKKAKHIQNSDVLSNKKIKSIVFEKGNFEVYDPVGVDKHSTYISEDIISHNTEFLGSSATLITGSKLKSLVSINPISIQDDFHIFEEPIPGHVYISCVDCAEGVGLDYSIINIIDATQLPYKQVARYRSNKIPLLVFPTVIYSVSSKYNEAFVMVETNNVGQQVVDILHYDLEYDNIFKVENHHMKGQIISSGFRKSTTLGLKTTKSVKKIGCANLKTLIETDKLVVNDISTIAELYTFVRIRDSYAAEEGNNDDLVMGLVFFGWLAAQAYFKDSTNIDIRKILIAEQEAYSEENLAPVGIIDNGKQEEVIHDGVDIWTEKGYYSAIL